jgi:hypothetical protein
MPIAFNMPASVGATLGAGRPGHGTGDTDLAVAAPYAERSVTAANSTTDPIVPEAATSGVGKPRGPRDAIIAVLATVPILKALHPD